LLRSDKACGSLQSLYNLNLALLKKEQQSKHKLIAATPEVFLTLLT